MWARIKHEYLDDPNSDRKGTVEVWDAERLEWRLPSADEKMSALEDLVLDLDVQLRRMRRAMDSTDW